MLVHYGENVKYTFQIFEIWSRNKADSDDCVRTLDVNDQSQLKIFAKYQIYVLKAFNIVLKLEKAKRKAFLSKEGTKRLAKRWQIWSNTCFRLNFLP